ncbi:MAG: CoA transferase subunit A [Proteobacteria bacterium]|nr:CoA transferase subunit A [Pseudomonadota bacterium]
MSDDQKLMSMSEAVSRFVNKGTRLFLGGFIQQEPFAAVHEIIRQGIRDLHLTHVASMLSVDQMLGAGLIEKLTTTFTWNPIPATAHCFVRAMTRGIPRRVELEEYSILIMNLALFAGALDLPYVASKSLMGSGFDGELGGSGARNQLKFEKSPFTGERVCLVPPLKHDVGIMQVQRCDPEGNAQAWGILGESQYGMLGCEHIIICCEEVVDPDVIRRDPNRTLIPGYRVDAVVEAPWGSHPFPMTGHYDMDWLYFAHYERKTRNVEDFKAFLDEWVYGVRDRNEYLGLLDANRLEKLRLEPTNPEPVSYGRLTRHFEV